ncbi:MAG: hypothetical protein ACLQGP_29905 [Isosphaeraceae bacterium]
MKPNKHQAPDTVDESAECEITIQPDGRVFAFGITGPMAAVLATIPTSDERMKRLLERISRLQPGPEAPETCPNEECH